MESKQQTYTNIKKASTNFVNRIRGDDKLDTYLQEAFANVDLACFSINEVFKILNGVIQLKLDHQLQYSTRLVEHYMPLLINCLATLQKKSNCPSFTLLFIRNSNANLNFLLWNQYIKLFKKVIKQSSLTSKTSRSSSFSLSRSSPNKRRFSGSLFTNVRHEASKLLIYFETHKYDPFNVLLGQEINRDQIEIMINKDHNTLLHEQVESALKCLNDTKFCLESKHAKLSSKPLSSSGNRMAAEIIIAKLLDWSSLNDTALLQMELTNFVTQLRSTTLSKGDLVLYKKSVTSKYTANESNNNNINIATNNITTKSYFARVSKVEDDEIELFPSYKEDVVIRVSPDKVEQLKPTHLEQINILQTDPLNLLTFIKPEISKIKEQMNWLIDDALNSRLAKFTLNLSTKRLNHAVATKQQLQQQQRKNALILKHNEDEIRISETKNLIKAKIIFSKFADKQPRYAYDKLYEPLSKYLVDKSNTTYNYFRPTLQDTLAQIDAISQNLHQLIKERILKHVETIEKVISKLAEEKKNVLDGTFKNVLASWYLRLIEDSVTQFVQQFGYDINAIPEDYTNEAPQHMRAVMHNSLLLSRITNRTGINSYNIKLKVLISSLQKKIYPKIEKFIEDAIGILCNKFNVQLTTLEQLKIIVESKKQTFSKEENKWISNVIKDIEYLVEMKRLEYVDKNDNFHIIPINGLVMSALVRMQQECKTVIEMWTDLTNKPSLVTKSDSVGNRLSCAVTSGDLLGAQCEMRDANQLNGKDSLGFTALHYSARSIKLFDICESLLQQPSLDVTAKCKYGNTALHYLISTIKGSASDRYLNLVKLMLDRDKNIVNCGNKEGETPLHLSCLAGSVNICSLLLQYKADPNLKAHSGEHPIIYAAQQGNKAILELLAPCSSVAKDSISHAAFNSGFLEISDWVDSDEFRLLCASN